jgi:acetylornithine/N-succinyldiaminopimelate aminotransferase
MIAEKTGMCNMFFGNSGAEANEGAIKLARKYSFDKYGEGRSTIVTLNKSFHGRTITTLKATGQDVFHQYFFPFTEGFKYCDAGDIDALTASCTDDVCAVMLEVVQGEGGVNILSADYLKAVETLCHERDILLIVDEVQTGIGRCGKFFGYMNAGINPDIVTTAKGLGGGLPIGTFIAGEKCAKTLGASMHGSTFGANPVSCAAACNVVSRITDEFLAEVNAKGAYMREKIAALGSEKVKEVRGIGMMTGIAVTVSPKDVLHDAFDNGLLVLTAGSDVVRLLPPLTISYEEIDRGIEILAKVLK